jgi:hypothetical protein
MDRPFRDGPGRFGSRTGRKREDPESDDRRLLTLMLRRAYRGFEPRNSAKHLPPVEDALDKVRCAGGWFHA